MIKLFRFACVALTIALCTYAQAQAQGAPHNVILFVPDGLRSAIVSPELAPTFSMVRARGVDFQNSHSLFPTFTTANASAFATGHYLGDTGDFSNTIYTGYPMCLGTYTMTADGPVADTSITPFLENDAVLGDIDERYSGNYLDEMTVLAAARNAGLSTAAVGKLGPTSIQDVTARDGKTTVVIDDMTGTINGIPVPGWVMSGMLNAGLPDTAPSRNTVTGMSGTPFDNGYSGGYDRPGTTVPNYVQQQYFVDALTKVILPEFKRRGKPFAIVFWSRDPDGSQHNEGDSYDSLVPGINGETSFAGIRNADRDLSEILKTLDRLGLNDSTDVVVSADHGFSTIAKDSDTSYSSTLSLRGTLPNQLPNGFVAIDIAHLLNLPLSDPDKEGGVVVDYQHGEIPRFGNGLIGMSPKHPEVIVAANGGSDLIYLPDPASRAQLAQRIVSFLLTQDYTSGVFASDDLGPIAGTLPFSAVNLRGSAITPIPAIALNFRSFSTGCDHPLICTAEIADTSLQQGQGMHGSMSRADTFNFMAAMGPDFKSGFVDHAPTSNADVGMTLADLLGLTIPQRGHLVGRTMTEALIGGADVPIPRVETLRSQPGDNGAVTLLQYQMVGTERYLDAGGFTGKTVGL